MLQFLTRLATFVINHLYLLLHLYDPILDQESKSEAIRECYRKFMQGKLRNIRRHFLVPCVYIPFVFAFGTIGLELDARQYIAKHGCNATAHALATSPHIFMHQITPPEMWPTTDLIILVVPTAGVTILYLFLTQNPMISVRHRMLSGGDELAGSKSG